MATRSDGLGPALAVAVLTLTLTLAGCGADTDVALHEPGVYQGKTDPLLDKAGTPQHNQRLANRFAAVQTDR